MEVWHNIEEVTETIGYKTDQEVDMGTVYQGLFWFGVLYAAIGFFIGHIADFSGANSMDVSGDSLMDGISGSEGVDHSPADAVSHPSPFKPIVIASFFIVFGGTGMMGEHFGWTFGQALGVALVLGGIVSTGLFKGVVEPLYRLQNTSAATRDQLIGLSALVTTPIYENGFGTISYRINDNIYNAPAKSLTGKYIAQGEKAVIVKFEGKAFIVHIADEFSKK